MLILQPDEKNLHPVCLALKLKKLSIIFIILYIIWGWVKTLVPSEPQNSW